MTSICNGPERSKSKFTFYCLHDGNNMKDLTDPSTENEWSDTPHCLIKHVQDLTRFMEEMGQEAIA